MKAIRIKLYMQTAHFNIPLWKGEQQLSYPLPPPSTIIGMIHSLCAWDKYHSMMVSICGTSHQETEICQNWIGGSFSTEETEEFCKRFPVRIWNGEGYVGYVKVPRSRELLIDLKLRIHIVPQDQTLVKEIYNSVLFPPIYPSLGRHEDLVRFDNVEIVNITSSKKDITLDLDAYASYDITEDLVTIYKLNKIYKIVKGKRSFQKIKVAFLSSDMKISCITDEDNFPVFLL